MDQLSKCNYEINTRKYMEDTLRHWSIKSIFFHLVFGKIPSNAKAKINTVEDINFEPGRQ